VILLNKKRGFTPLQAIREYQTTHPEYRGHTLSYAGRLDPMAEGLLLVLVDEENKKQSEFLHFEKEYIVECIFGVSTNSYDMLGRITAISSRVPSESDIENILPRYRGVIHQQYPPYSAVRVQGKPLLHWARKNMHHDLEIPTVERTISLFEKENVYEKKTVDIVNEFREALTHLEGTFPKEESLHDWESYEQDYSQVIVYRFRVVCSSGTYIRSLIHDIGRDIGAGATVVRLTRTRVGGYTL
jgi:tRNA pseudouridine55 synthase